MKTAPIILAFSLLATGAQAAVTNVAWYRLGENDPGAGSGVMATNTANLLGLNPLKPIGTPRYTNAVSPSAADGLGSSLAVHFSGTNQCFTNAIVSTATDNFGVEAWVNPDIAAPNNRVIAFNGNSVANGWGFVQSSSGYFGLLAGVAIVGLAPATPGQWTHLALVRDNGLTTFYVNGVAAGSSSAAAPNAPVGGFAIGARPNAPAEFFGGLVDEVRVFSFATGQFSTNDLLLNVRRVITLPATAVGPTNATLNGSVNPVGLPTSAWFEWGTTTNYGNVTPVQSLDSSASNTSFSHVLSEGEVGFTYHFRAVASNFAGVAVGTNQSFTTPVFTDIGAELTGVAGLEGLAVLGRHSSVAWGDYDNDGRLDILLTGMGGSLGLSSISEIWRNTGPSFTNINAGLIGVNQSSAAWGDYDNDGRLDILLAGTTTTSPHGQVWRNTGSGFTNINAGLPGVHNSSVAWGDYDDDGRLDILLAGSPTSNIFTNTIAQVWRNTGSGFIDINAGLPGVVFCSVAWGDYDNDGRLDILLTGTTNGVASGAISQVWRNTGAGFTNINAGLPGAYQSSAALGDYDNDGRLDIVLSGWNTNQVAFCDIWRNTGSGFTNINAGLGAASSSVAWGDYDNDGRLDILLSAPAQVWRNTVNGFTKINAISTEANQSAAAWGDYDNDGRLDILLSALSITRVWRNSLPVTNTLPAAPAGLTAAVSGPTLTLSWNAASDSQTPAAGLTYNVRAGTSPGGADVISPMAAGDGHRRLPSRGNAEHGLSTFSPLILGQTYYWSVQAVDTAFAGSPFSAESSFTLGGVFTPPNGTPVVGDIDGDGVVDDGELNVVLSNYWPYSGWLEITNTAGLGGTNVTFALTDDPVAAAFRVEYTTNLLDWYFLGPATPRYLFTDSNAPAEPQRHYRLRWP